MKLHFSKYQGTGNDFIIIDARSTAFDLDTARIAKLCHRRFGIGADGLILVKPSASADFKMVYFNSDGRESSMCGNGGRCVASFAFSRGIAGKEMVVDGIDGLHEAVVAASGIVRLKMMDVSCPVKEGERFLLNTGSPHVVEYVPEVSTVDVHGRGKAIRYSDRFSPEGTNVNFIQLLDGTLHVRTYERGVEDETLSCGTGVTAAVLACHFSQRVPPDCHSMEVNTLGGALKVSFNPVVAGSETRYTDVWLEGPAVHVFEGEVIVH